jgi:hypothetical protein
VSGPTASATARGMSNSASMAKASAVACRAARSGPSASRASAAPSARHKSGLIRCSSAAVTARARSAPPSRARRTEAGSGSGRQAAQSRRAVGSVAASPACASPLIRSSCRPGSAGRALAPRGADLGLGRATSCNWHYTTGPQFPDSEPVVNGLIGRYPGTGGQAAPGASTRRCRKTRRKCGSRWENGSKVSRQQARNGRTTCGSIGQIEMWGHLRLLRAMRELGVLFRDARHWAGCRPSRAPVQRPGSFLRS